MRIPRGLPVVAVVLTAVSVPVRSNTLDYLSPPVAYDNARDGFGQTFIATANFIAGVEFYIGDPSRPSDSSVNDLAGPASLVLEDISDPNHPIEVHRTLVVPAGESRAGIVHLEFDVPAPTVVGRKYFISIEVNDLYGLGVLSVTGSTYSGGAQGYTNCLSIVFPMSPCNTQVPAGSVVDTPNGRDTSFRIHVPDEPPDADAGIDFSVNEGQAGVRLDGSLSVDPDNDLLTFHWRQVVDGSPIVSLADGDSATPSFNAPIVAVGGETLTFELTVMAGGKIDTDIVSVTIVNVNHAPVAEAGADFFVAEGGPVTLDGSASFDIDNDVFRYTWTPRPGTLVQLTGASSPRPTFTAPLAGTGGAPGVVATLEFELRVDDDFPADAAAPGYELDDVTDVVVVYVTNSNNPPSASAGSNQTVDEHATVVLDAGASTDPDGDALTYSWAPVGGTTVALAGANSSTPSFTAPFVPPGGAAFTFEVTVSDGNGGTSTDTVTINVQNVNDPPLASSARPSLATLWPPNHKMVLVSILGVTDPNNDATITITAVTQDEPTLGLGDGDTSIDAVIDGDGAVLLRAERSGAGDGRVYRISFTASDAEGSSSGYVTVSVPHSPKRPAVDSGQTQVSTQ